ncbi:hypothetical protein GCM10009775_13080 [Microbacterium aoyamense]|uniref:WXG100 family type VII secretion target n=1 Tax=Microbacterium aoyamense TaxID=344166 RepID=A0ABN2PHF7_9MICO|nr:hypothetical protein [Microbacterium aoyamense]
MTFSACAPAATPELDVVVRELERLSDRLLDVAHIARSLAAATDWQARAAVAFHEKATRWAGTVSGLGCLAETTRIDAVQARESARSRSEWACP